MSWWDRMVGLGTKVIMLSEKTSELSQNVKEMTGDFHALDKRLLVVETQLGMLARNLGNSPPLYPPPPYSPQRPRLGGGDNTPHDNDPDREPGE